MVRLWRFLSPYWGRISLASFGTSVLAIMGFVYLYTNMPFNASEFPVYPDSIIVESIVVIFYGGLIMSLVGVIFDSWHQGGWLGKILLYIFGIAIYIFILA